MNSMSSVTIDLLSNHIEAIPVLKKLFESEWEPYYGKSGPGDAESDLKASLNQTELPIAIVAKHDEIYCGTAALKKESVTSYPDYSPWLAALIVAPEYRKRGIGELLIKNIEELAKKLDYEELYVGTGEKSGVSDAMLIKRNWKFIDKSEYFVSEVSIFSKTL